MNKSALAKSIGYRLRIQPIARGPLGRQFDDDWLLKDVGHEAVLLENTRTGKTVLIGTDWIHGYGSDPSRDTSAQKYGYLQLHTQVEIDKDGIASTTPLPPPRATGRVMPRLRPMVVQDGETERYFSWRDRDPVHTLIEEAPRQLLAFFVPLCDALRSETGREPEFQTPNTLDGDLVYELSADHQARWRLLGGMGGQPGPHVLVLRGAPQRALQDRAIPPEMQSQVVSTVGRGVRLALDRITSGLRVALTSESPEPKLDPILVLTDLRLWIDADRGFVAGSELRLNRVFQQRELDIGYRELHCEETRHAILLHGADDVLRIDGVNPENRASGREYPQVRRPGIWRADFTLAWTGGRQETFLCFDWDGRTVPRPCASPNPA